MPPCSCPSLGVVLTAVLVVALAVSARASGATDMPQPAAAPAAGSRFLHACCTNTTNASVCYDSLLPSAGSFHGNRVRVALTSSTIAYARLRTFVSRLRRLQQHGGTGSGRMADMSLQACLTFANADLHQEDAALPALRRLLTAAGRRRERAKFDLDTASVYVGGIEHDATLCMDDFGSTGNATLVSPGGNKMLAWAADVQLYSGIALDLIASINLEM
ncbi:hypothetical protein BDA96_02G263100 [Sorghum bicolor]|uniref:Pectinesterase inhibitor domain-containing protein n=1 Tax=Sorghum bicolor TaxID=4558 RepID=A0A921RR67_SORBI|nr:uncharacterized protein LOC8054747 [Sorghum bicolor]KAG0544295.1 hypothetical protein BDA96_02G263100 [Sorghum bicolor]|eukprot:XP_002462595.2 uncharacterized protein LOC8054747 [Sorghum bicolor]